MGTTQCTRRQGLLLSPSLLIRHIAFSFYLDTMLTGCSRPLARLAACLSRQSACASSFSTSSLLKSGLEQVRLRAGLRVRHAPLESSQRCSCCHLLCSHILPWFTLEQSLLSGTQLE